jgi:ABC-2 type transport system permease protein
MFLFGAGCLAVGTFSSSLTDNQMVAGVVGFGLLLILWILGWAGAVVTGPIGDALANFSLLKRFDDFQKGIIDLSSVLYYVSFISIFIFLAVRVIDSRRWS